MLLNMFNADVYVLMLQRIAPQLTMPMCMPNIKPLLLQQTGTMRDLPPAFVLFTFYVMVFIKKPFHLAV